MRFSSDELMFLTSITKGPAPFGVFFDKVKKKDGAAKAAVARDGLIKKEILTEDGITKKGFAAIKLWEEYRNAERFVVIKNVIIGILSNARCVLIYRDKEGFDIASSDKAELVYACLKEYPFLERADKKDKLQYSKENFGYEDFRARVKDFGKNIMTFGVFPSNNIPGEERFFYWDDKKIFSYNPHERVEKAVEPSVVRAFILDSFCIDLEVLANGR